MNAHHHSASATTSDDTHQWSRRKAAQDHYHRTLVDSAVLWITECAMNGWTPADLRHEFTAQIDPLLFHALSGVTHNVPDELLDHWFAQTRPSPVSALSVSALEKIVKRLPALGSLQDWTVLMGESTEEREERYREGLSPEQRKAHDRIQALLKKAESTPFEKEAEALVEKAESLRQQYRVETLLADSYAEKETRSQVVSSRVHLHSPWVTYQMRLLGTVARANSCDSLLLTTSGIATVFGTRDDVEHVLDLFHSLNRQRAHFMRTSAGAKTAQEQGETSSYRRSFMIAYATRIGALLKRASEEVLNDLQETAPCASDTVLPILKDRTRQAHQTLQSIFPHTRSLKVSANNLLGYQDGYAAAGNSHLGGDASGLEGQRSLETWDW